MAPGETVFYRVSRDGVVQIEPEQLGAPGVIAACLSAETFAQYSSVLGLEHIKVQEVSAGLDRLRNTMEVRDKWSAGLIHVMNSEDFGNSHDRLLFVITKDRFVLISLDDKDGSVLQMLEDVAERYRSGVTLEKFISGLLERILSGDGKMMEELDHQLLALEKRLVDGTVDKGFNRTIYRQRHRLMRVHNYYEQLVDIGEDLLDNANELFGPHDLPTFRAFVNKAKRLAEEAQSKSENLVHLREALDAELNYTLNNIMKLFTLLTAVFSPLMLIVGWYGMNFKHMPELAWPWGYPAVLVLCLSVAAGILSYFRRKRLM